MGPRAGQDILEKRKISRPLTVRQQHYATNVTRQLVFKIYITVKLHKKSRSKHSIGMQDNLLATVVHSVSHVMDPVEHRVVF